MKLLPRGDPILNGLASPDKLLEEEGEEFDRAQGRAHFGAAAPAKRNITNRN